MFAPPADIALVGGRVITVNPRDEVVDAVAIKGNRIAAVGSQAEIQPFISSTTRVVELQGRSVTPGFIENHIHMVNAPSYLYWLNVLPGSVNSMDDIRALVAERTKEIPAGEWILAHGYHPERLREGRHPTRHDLDSISPHHPVGLRHRESMSWTFNTLGLRRIGVQDHTPDAPGGPMQRDGQGIPLGPMFDNTRTIFIRPNLPRITEDQFIEGYRWLCKELNRHGITSAYEASIRNRSEVLAWRRLREAGDLTIRVNLGPYPDHGDDAPSKMFESGMYTTFGDEWIKMGPMTYGVDGGVFGQTAALYEPYSNDPMGLYKGSFRVTPEVADSFSLKAHADGWQISAVSHGDHGTTVAVDAIEKAQLAYPERHLRHRLEHAYLWNESLLERVGKLGIIWNTQLPIMTGLGRWGTLAPWGKRARFGFPVKSAMEHGVLVSGGSDWPVTTLDPMVGIHALVTRRLEPLENGETLNPTEAISVMEAIRIYTYNGAYTAFEEETKGSLEVGKLADLAVLSEDILTVAGDRIRELRTTMTIVDGRVVYEASAGL